MMLTPKNSNLHKLSLIVQYLKNNTMPEIIIKYKNPKTLQALKDFAKYFDYVISSIKPGKEEESFIKGVTVIPGDSSIDTSDLENIFSNKNINAKTLRSEAWQRRK